MPKAKLTDLLSSFRRESKHLQAGETAKKGNSPSVEQSVTAGSVPACSLSVQHDDQLSTRVNKATKRLWNFGRQKKAGKLVKGTLEVPLAGNTFITHRSPSASETICEKGLVHWNNAATVISAFFRVSHPGHLSLGVKAKAATRSTIKVCFNGTAKDISLNGTSFKYYHVGDFPISTPGYIKVDIQGVGESHTNFGELSHIVASGEAVSSQCIYSNNPEYYYWARRGPSCHLNYTIPTDEHISYYYNELVVPEGHDRIGSYFMAIGFAEGYFGVQVNSECERRILFSVWSPCETNCPKDVRKDYRVTLNTAGQEVHTGVFGGEGVGGQSYLKYHWIAGGTYKFLLNARPDNSGNTDYTAWWAPENGEWNLLASWKRPKTSTYLKGFYSFVENFNPDYGHEHRKVEFGNQWVRTVSGKWLPVSEARFSVDATYNAQQRVDAAGGTNGASFFLANGGFFTHSVPPGSSFSVPCPKQPPEISLGNGCSRCRPGLPPMAPSAPRTCLCTAFL